MRHRNDIDGLRAIAIASAVGFHLYPETIAGGFQGVDVFFVISGYLITRIISAEMDAGTFTLLDFYRRRVVRILPALLTVILATCAIGCTILLPSELRTLGISAAAAAAFVSNLYFWAGTDYFSASGIQPLLHSWSLGVEEQFYLLYPLVLLALQRWLPRHVRTALILGTAGSLLLSWLVTLDHPTSGFYLLPSRGWELGLGALVALGVVPRIAATGPRHAVAIAALLVLTASSLIRWNVGVPAPAAIPACLATALLIAWGEDGPSARLLALPPMRWLGAISYPLYLWHWPLLAYCTLLFGRDLPVPIKLAILAASLAAATLSWRFIERPFRSRFRTSGSSARIVLAGLAASLAVAAIGIGIAAGTTWIRPLPPRIAQVAAFAEYRGSPQFDYQLGPERCRGGTIAYDADDCLRIDPARRNLVVLGDSHAAHIWRAIAERFPADNVLLAASTRCRPLVGASGGRICRAMFDTVMQRVIAPATVQAVVLADNWQFSDIPRIAPTIRAIRARGIAVTLFGPVAQIAGDMPVLLARAMLARDFTALEAARRREVAIIDARLRKIAAAEGAHYYSLYDQECPAGKCRLWTRTGDPFHFDAAHLTLSGARELVEALPPI